MKIGINDVNTIVITKGYSGGKKNNTAPKIKKSIKPIKKDRIRGTITL